MIGRVKLRRSKLATEPQRRFLPVLLLVLSAATAIGCDSKLDRGDRPERCRALECEDANRTTVERAPTLVDSSIGYPTAFTKDAQLVWYSMDLYPVLEPMEFGTDVILVVVRSELSGSPSYDVELTVVGCAVEQEVIDQTSCALNSGLFDALPTSSSLRLAFDAELRGAQVRLRPFIGDLIVIPARDE